MLRGPTTEFTGDALAGTWNRELPGTGIEVVLEFDGVWDLELDGRRTETRGFVAGMVAGPVRSRSRGPVRLVQLAVDPLDLPALFGVPAGELSGLAAPADALLGADLGRLLDQLHGSDARTADAERWALSRIAASKADHRGPLVPADIVRATDLIRASRGAIRIEAVAAELGCSRRHLARRFAEWVGVTPSEFRRLARFEHVTGQLRTAPRQPLGSLALDCGFADHAHMDREFTTLAGEPPSAVAARFAARR